MDNYKVEKFLGQGIIGKVYLVEKDGKKYAMKIEYIDSKKDPYLQNELKFVKVVTSKYPEQFMQLIDYDFVHNCREESPEIPEWLDERGKEYIIKLRQKGICVRKVYSLIDSTLSNKLIEEMSLGQRYSMLIQLFYINHLIQSNGFVHGDFHRGNIGVINVSKDKNVKIFNKMIPTFGYQFVAIDYGGVLHKDTLDPNRNYQERQVSELQHFQEQSVVDRTGIINNMIDTEGFWDYVKKNGIKMNNIEDDSKIILSQPEIKLLKNITVNKYVLFDLYQLLFTKKFQQLVLREKFKEKIPIKSMIPTVDLIYAYSNFEDAERLISYFIARLENV